MRPAELAEWLAELEEPERAALADALRVGSAELQTARRRNGMTPYDPGPARRLAAALRGRGWPVLGHPGGPYVTVSTATQKTGVPGRTLRRWAQTGRVRSKRAGTTWLVHLNDVERENTRR